MKVGDLFLLTLIVYISIIQISASDQYFDEYDDQYQQFKRLILGTKKTSTNPPWFWNPSTTNVPSGACASKPCEHNGICIPKGQLAYDCKCVGPWRGIHCGIVDACYKSPCQNGGICLNVLNDYWCKCPGDYYGNNCQTRFVKRSVSKEQSFYKLLNNMKRVFDGQNGSNEDNNDGRAYYDYKNGIYF